MGLAQSHVGDDEVALDALRPRRLGGRQLAVGDPVGPVAEIFSGTLVEHPIEVDDQSAPAWPDWMRRAHASSPVLNVPRLGISRVALLPS